MGNFINIVVLLLLICKGGAPVRTIKDGPKADPNSEAFCPASAPQPQECYYQCSSAIVSKPAPQFRTTAIVENGIGKVSLEQYRGKYVVLLFYPLDFTYVCPTEVTAFSDRIHEFHDINAEVLACSVDSHFTHLSWLNTSRALGGLGNNIKIPLLSDLNHQISKQYGVYMENLGHSARGSFIIDENGILRQITINDLPVGRSIDETLRLIQAFQYTDTHVEVCPAGWKPGADTILPNPVEKIKYFQKYHEYN